MKLSYGVLVVGCLALCAAASAQEYDVVDLGTLGGIQSQAWGISENGAVSGWSTDAGGRTRAFLWRNGGMADLGALPGATNSQGHRINGDRVIGFAVDTNSVCRAVLWVNGTITNLTPAGSPESWAYDINDAGDGIGRIALPPGYTEQHACLFKNGSVIDLGTYNASDYSSWPWGINDRTQIVGKTFAFVDNECHMPFVWEDKNHNGVSDPWEMDLLGTFGGDYGEAFDINNSSQIVGFAKTINAQFHAFIVNPKSGVWKMPASSLVWTNAYMTDLGTLGGAHSRAYAINGDGVIVGEAGTTAEVMNACIWRSGAIADLHDLIPANSGWHLLAATDINDAGEIVGYGTIGGETHGFLLTALRRILQIEPEGAYYPVVFTNYLGDVSTQQAYVVEGLAIRWSSLWAIGDTNFEYTVEARDPAGAEDDWSIVPPTNQWPIAGSMWTSPVEAGIKSKLFRVLGEPLDP